MKQKASKKAGFTLLELLVAMAVMLILVGGVASLMQPSLLVYRDSMELSRGRRLAEDVITLVEAEVSYGSNLVLDTEVWGEGEAVSGAKKATYRSASYGQMALQNETDGTISMRPVKETITGAVAFGKDYYMGNTILMGLSLAGQKLTIQIAVMNQDGQRIGFLERDITLQNMAVGP